MAPIAYVLIDTNYGERDDILERLRKIDGVTEAYKIKKGAYGIVAKVDKDSDEEFNKALENLKGIKGIKCTLTGIADI